MSKIFYHNDADGIATASIVKHKVYPDAKLVSVGYKDENDIPDIKDCDFIAIVDFTFSKEVMGYLLKNCKHLLHIDHHPEKRTRMEEVVESKAADLEEYSKLLGNGYEGYFPCTNRDESIKSDVVGDSATIVAARIYFKHTPLWCTMVDAWDTHKKEQNAHMWNEIRHLKQGIQMRGCDWLHLDENGYLVDMNHYLLVGEGATDYFSKFNKKAFKKGETKIWKGHRTRFVNTQSMTSEDLSEEDWKDIDLVCFYAKMQNQWKYSLRSKDNIAQDVANMYGGGGHPNAAGFHTNELLEIIASGWDDDYMIKDIWCIEDVQAKYPECSEEDAIKVLKRMEKMMDCEEGLNWYTVEAAYEWVMEEKYDKNSD